MTDLENLHSSPILDSGPPRDARDRVDMLLQAGDFANAIPLLRELITASPADPALQRQLASALDVAGAAEDAIACYRRALSLDLPTARLGKGRVYLPRCEHPFLVCAALSMPEKIQSKLVVHAFACVKRRFSDGPAVPQGLAACDSWHFVL